MVDKLRALFHTFKWQILAVFAAVVGILFLVLRLFVLKSGPEHNLGKPGEAALPEPPKVLRDAVDSAHEDALQARAEAKAKADVDKQALIEISKIQDGAERRKQLANQLRSM